MWMPFVCFAEINDAIKRGPKLIIFTFQWVDYFVINDTHMDSHDSNCK